MCYNQNLLGKHTSQAAYWQTLNSQWRTPVFLLSSSKWRNLLVCVCSSDPSVIHGHDGHQFECWLQTFMLCQLFDPWAVFKFPTDLAPALVPQPRRTQLKSQTRADITTSGSHFPGFPQEQIRGSECESKKTVLQLRAVQCECIGALMNRADSVYETCWCLRPLRIWLRSGKKLYITERLYNLIKHFLSLTV